MKNERRRENAASAAFAAAVLGIFAMTATASQTWYVDAASGNDENDGLAAQTAFASIQKAIDSAETGDKVIVNDGVYDAISSANKLIAIESVNGAARTIIDGNYPGNDPDGYYRAATLGNGARSAVVTNTLLRGFTLRNGYASYGGGGAAFGTLERCLITNNTASIGGGSWGGRRIECIFTGNTADCGGAMAGGMLERCVVANNSARSGGGVYCSQVKSSIICNNHASSNGGGAYAEGNSSSGDNSCCMEHCTLYGNSAAGSGGGMYKGIAENCIVWGNTAGNGLDAHSATISYSCASNIVDRQGNGEGNIAENPQFVSAETGDWHLQDSSPCINAGKPGTAFGTIEKDFDGNRRIREGRTDMGAYEASVDGIAGVLVDEVEGGGVLPLYATVETGRNATFTAFGPRPFLGFFTNGVFATSNKSFELKGGIEDVVLTAEFDLSESVAIYADAGAEDVFADGDTPLSAMKLQTAIDMSIAGDTIHVADGIYGPIESNGKAITIRSVNGRESAVIDGGGSNRCATLLAPNGSTSASKYSTKLIGFTLRNGKSDNLNGNGGGCQGGTLIDCRLHDNFDTFGGGAYYSALVDCLVETNSATQGGGLYNCEAVNCVIRGNYASAHGGGTGGGGTYVECAIEDNISDFYGGGSSRPVSYRCIYRRNKAKDNGGGVNSGELYNCLLERNEAEYGGGGASTVNGSLVLVNCTVWGNVAGKNGGGIYAPLQRNIRVASAYCQTAAANNSIVYGNSLIDGTDSNYSIYNGRNESIVFNGSCSFPLPDGDGNLDSFPEFADEWNGDFRLRTDSQCIDNGRDTAIFVRNASSGNGYYTVRTVKPVSETDPDLPGNPRKMFGSFDIGAFESQTEPPREVSHADIWGDWSTNGNEPYMVPESVATWDELSKVLWRARDAYVKSGARTEVPPSEGAIVLSLGAISVPDGLMTSEPPIEIETEHGVSVWRLRVFEDTNTCSLVAVAGKSEFGLSAVPSYLANAWVDAVYGQPPAWLDANETDAWHAARSRSRIEWFVTLVPQSLWTTYCANRAEEADGTRTRGSECPLAITGFRPDSATGIHNVSVRSSAAGETRLWSMDSLSSTNWTYNGYSLQAPGTTAAGVHSASNQMFVTATFSETALDSDSDGIPDVMEEKVYGTNPGKADSSGDGISDWEKVYRYGLNPRVQDTAGDEISDDEKILSGTDPRVPLPPARKAAASRSIRYIYDDDDRLTGTFSGLGGAAIKTELTPAGNPAGIHSRNAAK